MGEEDISALKIQRAELVAQQEEIEDLQRSLKEYYHSEEISYFMNSLTPQFTEYMELKINLLLKSEMLRTKNQLCKHQDIDQSVISDNEGE